MQLQSCLFTDFADKQYSLFSCEVVYESLSFVIDNRFIKFGITLYRQTVGMPISTNCAALIADLFLFCYERDFNNTFRYIDDMLNMKTPYFAHMVSIIYLAELTLLQTNTSDIEASFLDLFLTISNGIVTTRLLDKRDDFDFEIVNYPHLNGDVPRATCYGVYVSPLDRFAKSL